MTTDRSYAVRAEEAADGPAIAALLDQSFGPGRYARTAYRLREGVGPIAALGLVAEEEGALVASVRFWPVRIGDAPALLLGPLVVAPERRNQGYGLAAMKRGLALAAAAGHALVLLVGDPPYYARAGFQPVPVGKITMPGPVDPTRLLAAELVPGALAAVSGEIGKP
jgi:predicted N-acetyltransferase YhbS